jgi:hypothetical protein
VAPGATSPEDGRNFAGARKNDFPVTKLDAKSTYRELGRRRTRPRVLGGWLWLRVNGATEGGGAANPGMPVPVLRLGAQENKGGARFSPRRQASGEGDGVLEATQREIDADDWRLRATVALRPRLSWRGGEGFRGAGSSCERRRHRSKTRRNRGLVHRRRGEPDGR